MSFGAKARGAKGVVISGTSSSSQPGLNTDQKDVYCQVDVEIS